MNEFEGLKFFATMGVGGILAGIMFIFYRKDVKLFTDQWKGQSEMLMQVVKENTGAITKNATITEALHRRLGRDEDIKNG